MSDFVYYNGHNEVVVSEKEIIQDLREEGYTVLESKLDYTDRRMLDEIVNLFLASDLISREKIYKTILKL